VQHVRAIVVSVLGCAAVAAAGIPPSSAQRPAGEAASGAEEVEATPSLVREIQFMLLRIGIDPGPIDGVVGPQTAGAFRKFREQSGVPGRDLANGGRVSTTLLAKLRGEASRAMFEGDNKPQPPAAASPAPTAAAPPAVQTEKPDRFAQCTFNPEDFRIGETQYTPDKYLQVGFDGSTARAVAMLRDRLSEARQIAENVGGAALAEVQRQSRVLNYYSCRLKVEQASSKQ
jgi:peptidoglycan hydrolase-like protein with peptidoglycan-binding domain